jgi:ATP-binding cassette, subfamily C, bacteriocin exporter
VKSYQQRDGFDCGAACLSFILDHHGKTMPLPQLRQLVGTGQQGSTALGLVEAARHLGLAAKGVKAGADTLPLAPYPAIAHCLIDQKLLHYVVVVACTAKVVRVMDPAVGRIEKWPRAKFQAVWTGVLILASPAAGFEPGDSTVPAWRRLWALLAPHKAVLAQTLVGAVISAILGLSMSVYVQKIVDHVIPDGNRPLLNLLGISMMVLLCFKVVIGVFQSLLTLRTAQQIDASLILAYYGHLMRLPQPFFDSMRIGEITSRIGDAVKVRHFLNHALLNLVLNPLVLIFSLSAMFIWSWQLAVLSLALVPINIALYGFIDWRNRTYQRRIMEHAADFDAHLVESLHAQPALRRFRLEDQAELRTEKLLVQLLRTGWRAGMASLGTGTASNLITQIYLIALLWLGASLVLDTGLSPGQLMSCYTLASYLTGPINGLLGLNTTIRETLVATDRLFEVMDLEGEIDEGLIEFRPEHAAGPIRFERVTFKHAGRLATLDDLSVTFPAGHITAIVGESGCGKSTLLALIQRLYSPGHGRVLIGRHDIRHFRLESLRRHLAVVPQQTHLLSGTVLENLAPGEIRPDMERIFQLCREVGSLDFIERLPKGFLTPVGENGGNLSGGQRQRLALVRALYLDAPILLLDEPSSALDAASERTLIELLIKLRDSGRTIIIATHTTAYLSKADQIVTMSQGRPTTTESKNVPSVRAE